ncbi:MAG: hypothetical protein CL930_11640 [Deltaproteobacteria bacterium]|mgnify:CR=1 FL=1|jgi:hypothetical protein|nr:hypothetical protein [Deltaproteobacteria bacterium]|tara:strand:+ start:206 stop:772 length:567 start_codon:yes stop_codon:yes gene_type:complete
MAQFELEWIDKDATQGPVFRIGKKDVYVREYADQRVLRLRAKHSPNLDYLRPAIQAFHELAEHWGAPIIYVIDPDVKKPPSGQFLYEWSRAAWANGSVDQAYMFMRNPFTEVLGRFVCRMFCAGAMPFETIKGDDALQARLNKMDTSVGREGFSLEPLGGALVVKRRFGQGAYGQLLTRLFRRAQPEL